MTSVELLLSCVWKKWFFMAHRNGTHNKHTYAQHTHTHTYKIQTHAHIQYTQHTRSAYTVHTYGWHTLHKSIVPQGICSCVIVPVYFNVTHGTFILCYKSLARINFMGLQYWFCDWSCWWKEPLVRPRARGVLKWLNLCKMHTYSKINSTTVHHHHETLE